MTRFKAFSLLASILVLLICSCNSDYTIGEKKGYFRIDFPEKKYQSFDRPDYPYSFEYPSYANIIKDTTFFESKPENPWWINIDFPQFAARVHISYKEVGKDKFDSLVNDAFKMSYKQHTYKASAIEDSEIVTPSGIHGMYFTLMG